MDKKQEIKLYKKLMIGYIILIVLLIIGASFAIQKKNVKYEALEELFIVSIEISDYCINQTDYDTRQGLIDDFLRFKMEDIIKDNKIK